MKLLRSFTLIAALAGTTTLAFADTKAPAPAADKKADPKAPAAGSGKTDTATTNNEISKEDADKFLAFFNTFVDAIVNNKDNCPKMAGAINQVIDKNQDLIKKANEAKAAGKKLPKALEEKMMTRVKDMMPAMQKCGADKDVQAALKRMDTSKSDTSTKAPETTKAPDKPAAGSAAPKK